MVIRSVASTAGQAPLNYQWVKGTTAANGVVRVFSGAAEVSTGAYPAAVTGDAPIAEFKVKGFR